MNTLLIQSFTDTMRVAREDPAIAAATKLAQAGTALYLEGYESILRRVKSDRADIEVAGDTTFHCAQGLVNGADRVAVLNFANAFNPGGGVVHGAMAQEECLCRSSDLYCALTLPYLKKNYYDHNSKTVGDLGTDAVIYTPGVTVFKSDDALPVMLPKPFQVDVITCAAPCINPEKRRPIPLETLEKVIHRRLRNILEVAIARDVDVLVLGAIGCGAFNNPPEVVAEQFRRLLIDEGYRDHFKRVVFAIKPGRRDDNLETFRSILVS